MQCKKCGTIIKDGEKFCGNCGEVVTQVNNNLNANNQSVNNQGVQSVQPTSVNTNQSTIQQQPTSVNVSQDTLSQQQIISNTNQEAIVEQPTSDWIGDNNKKDNKKKSNIGIIIFLIIIIALSVGGVFYFLNNNESKQKNNQNDDSSLDNSVNDNNNDNNNGKVNYVLNDKLANVYKPITDTKIKTEDTGIIVEINANKNVGYYLENCGQNCEPTMININGEHAKYITSVSYGVAAMYYYVILTEEGNIYKGDINNTIVGEAKKFETDNKFVNITYGGNRVEQSGKARSVLGITNNNDYYNIVYCSNTKSGDYLTYSYYSDISDPNNTKKEYVLIYKDGFLSYLSISSSLDAQLCDNYNYNQYIVNSNNERIQAQVVLYSNGFYILGTDGYLYKLTATKNGDNYVAELYGSKKVESYSYEQGYAYIRNITFEYNDKTEETIEDTYGNVQIVMVKEK